MRSSWIFSLAALSGLVLYGCGAGSRPYVPSGTGTTPTPMPTTSPVATPSPTPTPTPSPSPVPNVFTVTVVPVSGQLTSSRIRLFDVTVIEESGSGEVALTIDTANHPNAQGLPEGTTISGPPPVVTLPAGSMTFRVTVTLPEGATSEKYGFGVKAVRGGRTETATTAFLYQVATQFNITARAEEIFEPHRVEIEVDCKPQDSSFAGTVSVERIADGNLTDSNGQPLVPLPADWEIIQLPQNVTFDGTGASKNFWFFINPGVRPLQNTMYGVRIRAGGTEKVIPIEASGSE
ncbi:MAG: hypothetical protein QM758_28220 [Armatimonas sp.]